LIGWEVGCVAAPGAGSAAVVALRRVRPVVVAGSPLVATRASVVVP
jgi:hypothetical protein